MAECNPHAERPPSRVTLIRRWLGDQAVLDIEYNRQYGNPTDENLIRLSRTFPEAKVREVHIPTEPCHPGCFPRGTLVETISGPRQIETMQVGDSLRALLPSGEFITVQVQSIFVTDNRLWRIRTEAGELLTTETQPLCLTADEFQAAGQLQPGDEILRGGRRDQHDNRAGGVADGAHRAGD